MAFDSDWFNSFVKLICLYGRELDNKNSGKGLMWHSELSMDNQGNTLYFILLLYFVIMGDCNLMAWSECKISSFASE